MFLNNSKSARSSGYKQVIDCKSRLTLSGTTNDWLNNIEHLNTLDDSKTGMSSRAILSGILDKNKNIVAKVNSCKTRTIL